MKLSIIVPAYNEEKYLGLTLEKISSALIELAGSSEIIVVNNESTDKTVEIAARYKAWIVNESIHNISRVRNAGAGSASGDVLVFIDADTLVPGRLFKNIADIMIDSRCHGGAVDVSYDSFERKWVRYYSMGWKFWGRLLNMKQGAAQFARVSAFKAINGYDEGIFMGEDIDFYWRLSKHAKQSDGYVKFIDDPKVVTSGRRFDKMSILKTLVLTHPIFIWSSRKRASAWKDWYENAVR